MADPTRVLIVDDSRIFRGVLQDALSQLPGVSVIGSVWNGEKAIEAIERSSPDLVTLDLQMPGMDGMATLRAIEARNARLRDRLPVEVLLISSHTASGARTTVEALEAGAFDFITKPEAATLAENREILTRALACKLQTLRSKRTRQFVAPESRKSDSGVRRRFRSVRAIVIGVSTGGPQALAKLLPDLARRISIPIVIVQHMPAGFTHFLAESLSKKCGRVVREAVDGEAVLPGSIFIAPGQRHLLLRSRCSELVVGLNDQEPENGCRPSADVLFRSAAAVLRCETVGVILTGMGSDGTLGLGALKRAGAYTIAQDEATSVVWGMPGSAVAACVIDEVLPLDRIASAIGGLVAQKEPGR